MAEQREIEARPGALARARRLLGSLGPDAGAALVVLFLAIPQGLAYATIAGLPPAAGLYAAALPTVVGSLFRSSKHVIVGPTNALSLLVGAAVIATSEHDPIAVGIALAFGVALFQLVATALRLSTVVDYISSPTVLGYITGAGLLIGIGQLHNVTGTHGPVGRMWTTIGGWIEALPAADRMTAAFAGGTVLAVIVLRWLSRRARLRAAKGASAALDRFFAKLPAALVVMLLGIAINLALNLEQLGLRTVSDLSPIPAGLPPLTMPSPALALELAPVALACTVLSLVESNAVARSIASRTGQRLDARREFLGQGLANLAASLSGGYPVSGSLSRSVLNEQAGARTRAGGVLTGLMMIAVLLALARLLDHTPIASLAGLLLVVAWDLVDVPRIRRTLRSSPGDALAFVATMIGTWTLALDQAIYLGVGVSLVLFLRKARLLTVRELVVDESGRLQEQALGQPLAPLTARCEAIRLLHVEGPLFFGSAGELRRALDPILAAPGLRVLVLRVKRAIGLDLSVAEELIAIAELLRSRGQQLVMVGMSPDMMEVLERSGAGVVIGKDNLIPTRRRWFEALTAAIARGFALSEGLHTSNCPLARANPSLPGGALNPDRAAERIRSLDVIKDS
ncbi:MAG TPA: SulP family inorganic anion transporter [Enhygromyxa sp.]|nr:SulP family inorganic anion transporter [Enhygromyxa sp.]